MKNLIVVLSFLLLAIPLFSQTMKRDVVYLKNGSIIRGNITGKTSEIIKIETEGNNLWVFELTEVDSVKSEDFILRKKEIQIKQRGFYTIGNAGIMAGRNSYRNLLSPGVTMINGYRFNKLSLGIGIGAEIMEILSAPLFGELRYDLLKNKNLSPFVSLQGGYSFPLQNNYGFYGNHYKGGILFNPEVGIRNYISDGFALVMSIGYRRQELHSTMPYYWQGSEKIGKTETVTYFNRIVMRLGFIFN